MLILLLLFVQGNIAAATIQNPSQPGDSMGMQKEVLAIQNATPILSFALGIMTVAYIPLLYKFIQYLVQTHQRKEKASTSFTWYHHWDILTAIFSSVFIVIAPLLYPPITYIKIRDIWYQGNHYNAHYRQENSTVLPPLKDLLKASTVWKAWKQIFTFLHGELWKWKPYILTSIDFVQILIEKFISYMFNSLLISIYLAIKAALGYTITTHQKSATTHDQENQSPLTSFQQGIEIALTLYGIENLFKLIHRHFGKTKAISPQPYITALNIIILLIQPHHTTTATNKYNVTTQRINKTIQQTLIYTLIFFWLAQPQKSRETKERFITPHYFATDIESFPPKQVANKKKTPPPLRKHNSPLAIILLLLVFLVIVRFVAHRHPFTEQP